MLLLVSIKGLRTHHAGPCGGRLCAGNGERSGRKLLRRKLLGETVVAWYPQDIVKADPFMLDIKAEK